MSEVTKQAIYRTLSGDETLVQMLARDAGGRIAIYGSSLNKHEDGAFPCITFRESSGTSDLRFRGLIVDSEIFDLEIWARTSSNRVIAQIAAEVDRLLHGATLAVVDGRVFEIARVAQNPDNSDPRTNLRFGLYRYRVRTCRW